MNCILGADKINCDLLEGFIGKSSSLTLAGRYSDSESIRNQLSKGQDTGLFFLDIDVPGLDLFNYVRSLNFTPKIILLSSNVHDALKAFDIDAIDFILKPVSYPRFFKAIDKAIKFHSYKESKTTIEKEVFIKKGSVLIKLKLKNLNFIEANENYITLHSNDGKFTVHFTMKAIEDQLPSGVFIRVHRSFIVNKNLIHSVKEDSIDLVLGNSMKNIPLGNSFREKLMSNITMVTR